MKNLEIRKAAQEAQIFLWQVAGELGIQDSTLSRKLRRELPEEEKHQILEIIDRLKGESK